MITRNVYIVPPEKRKAVEAFFVALRLRKKELERIIEARTKNMREEIIKNMGQ